MNQGEPPKTQPDPDPAFDLLAAVKVLATCAEEHESDESHECQRYCLELWRGHECRRFCQYNPLRIAALVMDGLGLANTDLAEVGRELLEREMRRETYRRNIYMQWLMNQPEDEEILNANVEE